MRCIQILRADRISDQTNYSKLSTKCTESNNLIPCGPHLFEQNAKMRGNPVLHSEQTLRWTQGTQLFVLCTSIRFSWVFFFSTFLQESTSKRLHNTDKQQANAKWPALTWRAKNQQFSILKVKTPGRFADRGSEALLCVVTWMDFSCDQATKVCFLLSKYSHVNATLQRRRSVFFPDHQNCAQASFSFSAKKTSWLL